MKKTQINIALNALALAGMLVFASQAANAASISQDSSPDPTPAAVQSTQSVADDATPDVADTNEIENDTDVAEINAQDIDIPDASEVEAATELEQEGPESK